MRRTSSILQHIQAEITVGDIRRFTGVPTELTVNGYSLDIQAERVEEKVTMAISLGEECFDLELTKTTLNGTTILDIAIDPSCNPMTQKVSLEFVDEAAVCEELMDRMQLSEGNYKDAFRSLILRVLMTCFVELQAETRAYPSAVSTCSRSVLRGDSVAIIDRSFMTSPQTNSTTRRQREISPVEGEIDRPSLYPRQSTVTPLQPRNVNSLQSTQLIASPDDPETPPRARRSVTAMIPPPFPIVGRRLDFEADHANLALELTQES